MGGRCRRRGVLGKCVLSGMNDGLLKDSDDIICISTITGIDIDRVIEISSLFSFGTVCSEGVTYFVWLYL